MKLVTTFQPGYEIKFQEKLDVIELQIPEASPTSNEVCNDCILSWVCITGVL